MLIAEWLTARLADGAAGFEVLLEEMVRRAGAAGLTASAGEVRLVLERLLREGRVEACQYLAEDDRYAPTVYDNANVFFYVFRLKQASLPAAPAGEEP